MAAAAAARGLGDGTPVSATIDEVQHRYVDTWLSGFPVRAVKEAAR